jgi:hypothetical protein
MSCGARKPGQRVIDSAMSMLRGDPAASLSACFV